MEIFFSLQVQSIEEFPDSPLQQATSRGDIYDVLKELRIESLKNFQWEAIESVLTGESVIVTNKCGSGKSLCFVIPALIMQRNENKFTLVIEPTVALIQDQVQSLLGRGIDAIALGAPAGSTSMRRENYSRFTEEKFPTLAYCTPEYIFGPSGDFLRNKVKTNLGLIAIDECHKVLDRKRGYRDSYSKLMDFIRDNDAPVLACSATLTREWLELLKTKFSSKKLHCLLNPIARNNIDILIEPYTKQKNKDESGGYNWNTVTQEIANDAQEHVSIVFVDTQIDAQNISQTLNNLGVGARFMVGGNMTSEEKQIAAKSFREGKDQVLVATETYECGMHNEKCTQVIRIGCPRNLPVLVQEMGRTGRNSGDGKIIILFNEFFDDQRLTTWVGARNSRSRVDMNDPEVLQVISHYVLAWRFLYSPLVGICSHLALSRFFDDPAEDISTVQIKKVIGCNCHVCKTSLKEVDISQKLRVLLDSLHDLCKLEVHVTMRHFIEFAKQSTAKWLFESPSITELSSFGFARSWDCVDDDGLKNLVRICISEGFIQLGFEFIFVGAKNIPRSFRRLSITEEGLDMIESEESFVVPDPFSSNSSNSKRTGKAKRKTAGTPHYGLPCITDLLQDSSCWKTLLSSTQFRLLGVDVKEFPAIYSVRDWRELPDASEKEFMRHDLQMTKGQGRVIKLNANIDGQTVPVLVKMNKCKGSKKCPESVMLHLTTMQNTILAKDIWRKQGISSMLVRIVLLPSSIYTLKMMETTDNGWAVCLKMEALILIQRLPIGS